MLPELLADLPPWASVTIALSLTVVLALLLAEAVARLVRMLLGRALPAVASEDMRAGLRKTVRLVRWFAFLVGLAVLVVPVLELTGHHTVLDLKPEQVLEWLMRSGLRITLIVGVAWLLWRMADAVVTRLEYEAAHSLAPDALERSKRIRTLGDLVKYVAGVLVTGVAALMVLRELHLDITPVLTGAGIVGLAVGFGAQSIVKDFFSGFFLILENQVRVGDVAVVNGVGGLVEAITLRTITLRDIEGTVHIFPNGSIATIANRTKDFSFAVLDVSVGYGEDIDRVIEVLKQVAAELQADERIGPNVLEPAEVLGVDQLGDSGVVIKMRVKTLPQKQWETGRELRRRIKRRFDAEGIEIPFPQLALWTRTPRTRAS